MRMSKHHATALLLLGIAVCAGFFLSVPAAAGLGKGFEALESGDLFRSPFGTTPPEPSVSPALPEDTPDLLPAPDDAEPVMPVGPDNTSEPAGPDNTSEPAGPDNASEPAGPDNTSEPAGPDNASELAGPTPVTGATDAYDDERLARLINIAGVSLMRLSMEYAHALCLQDADAAATAADDLHAFSVRLLNEVEGLRVSPAGEPAREEFVRVLKEYSAASKALLDAGTAGEDAAPATLENLSAAAADLEAVNRQALDMRPAAVAVTTLAAVPAGPAPVAPPAETLALGERYTYDDSSGENMVSLLVESTRTVATYEAVPTNGSTTQVEAGDGRTFLLVVVKGTNLGHKGDSDLYTIETPGRDAFTLEYQGTVFTPLDVPAYTLYGESFDKKTLERYESEKGYLYFDVPVTFEASGAILRADLGDAGTPAWDLGREPGSAA